MPFLILLFALFIFALSKGMYIESIPVGILLLISLVIETNIEKAKKLLDQYF